MLAWALGTVILLVAILTAALAGLLVFLSQSSESPMKSIFGPLVASLNDKFNGPEEPPVIDKRNQLKDSGIFTSKRFLVAAGSLVALYYLGAAIAPDVLRYGTFIVIAYILCDTIKGSVIAVCNAMIHKEEVRQDIEYEKLKADGQPQHFTKANP
jgi:hypothetical protein